MKEQSSILTQNPKIKLPDKTLVGVKPTEKKEVTNEKAKAKIKKVMKGLQKASKTHASQAKTLKGVLHGGSKKRNGKKA